MSGLSRDIGGWWRRFWFREVDGTALGLVRISVAGAGIILWVATLPLLERFYSDAGEFPIQAARAWAGSDPGRFLMPDVLGSLPVTVVIFGLQLLALGCLLVGYRTRVSAWASWLLLVWIQARNPTFLTGGDEILRLTSFALAVAYLGLPPRDRALSLDRLGWSRSVEGRSIPAPRVPVWTLRLVQIQVAVVYFTSGFWKLLGESWWNGDAVYYAVANTTFTRFGLPDWAWAHSLFLVAGWAVMMWEVLFPVLVARRRTRGLALVFGVGVHLLILATMNIGIFSLAMLATYPAFLDPDGAAARVRGALARLARFGPGGWVPGPRGVAEASAGSG